MFSASIRQYSYDIVSGRCLPFHYGGCGGNANRFDTESECLRLCSNVNVKHVERLYDEVYHRQVKEGLSHKLRRKHVVKRYHNVTEEPMTTTPEYIVQEEEVTVHPQKITDIPGKH